MVKTERRSDPDVGDLMVNRVVKPYRRRDCEGIRRPCGIKYCDGIRKPCGIRDCSIKLRVKKILEEID